MKKRILFGLILVVLVVSCNQYNCKKNIPELFNNMPNNIEIIDCLHLKLMPDYTHPQHTYLVLEGTNSHLISFVESDLGLQKYHENNFSGMENEYAGYQLWEFNGAYNKDTGKEFIEKYDLFISPKETYAGYFLSETPNVIQNSYFSKWNGKVVAYILDDRCFVFIEELYLPEFKLSDKSNDTILYMDYDSVPTGGAWKIEKE